MSTVKPENQIDFRTQRTNTNQKRSDWQRERRKMFKALGICYSCEKEPVQNKSICRTCSLRNELHNERRIFKKHGIPLPAALLLPSELAALQIPF